MGRRRRFKKKIVPSITITGIADKGKSVGRMEDGQVIFVEDAIPGDVVEVEVYNKKKGFFQGKATTIHHYSIDRTTPFCEHFGVCGGCKWQHLSYEAQLRHKQATVENALQRIGKIEVQELQPILPAERTTYYRNKLEYSFSNKKWLTKAQIESGITNREDVLGFHRAGAFDKVVNVNHCWLQPEPSNAIRNRIRAIAIQQGLSFYDARANTGFLRNMIIRVSSVGEIMLIMAFHEDEPEKYKPLLDQILKDFPTLTTLLYCINPKVNDYLMDLDMITYFGKGYIQEKLRNVYFRIGPKSFFQTNTHQGKRLYDTVVEFADLQGTENVYDLYTGIGSIALYVAQQARQVVGIEEIEAAIEDAKVNADLNKISNAIFYAGDVRNILTPQFAEEHGKPDLLITDPPRAGMHTDVVKMLLQLSSPKLVYVSCNPATQARDLNLLSEQYEVIKVRPVDMFPHTHHIESVALLKLK